MIASSRSERASRDQRAEDAAATREVADLRHRLRIHPGVDEAFEPRSRRVDHAERRVPRPGQVRGRLGQLQQQIVERELGAQRDAGVDEPAKAAGRRHGPIIRVGWQRAAALPQTQGGCP